MFRTKMKKNSGEQRANDSDVTLLETTVEDQNGTTAGLTWIVR